MQPSGRSSILHGLAVFLLCFVVYSLTSYGGARSPDTEVLFRVARSVGEGRGFSFDEIRMNPGFGGAIGKDGKLYSVYPPGASIAMAPFVVVAQEIKLSGWFTTTRPPLSHYVDAGLWKAFGNKPPKRTQEHVLRLAASVYNVLTGALCGLAFWWLALTVVGKKEGALAATGLFVLGSMIWPYSGTMFSEPLATLFVILSLALIAKQDPAFVSHGSRFSSPGYLLSGLALGAATATHYTAILFAPFFFAYIAVFNWKSREGWKERLVPLVWWGLGVALMVALLLYFNYMRFGDVFESGRNLSPRNKLLFRMPWGWQFWKNLYGLLFSLGKGLVIICPAVVLAALGWPVFWRKHRALVLILAAAALFRWCFSASYHDWHAGFGLGPRYLLPVIPFLLIPFGFWWQASAGRLGWMLGATFAVWLCAIHQFYFTLGDIFLYYHSIKLQYMNMGLSVFEGDKLYYAFSPLFNLLDTPRAAYLLRAVPLSNRALWELGSALLFVLIFAAAWTWRPRLQTSAKGTRPFGSRRRKAQPCA